MYSSASCQHHTHSPRLPGIRNLIWVLGEQVHRKCSGQPFLESIAIDTFIRTKMDVLTMNTRSSLRLHSSWCVTRLVSVSGHMYFRCFEPLTNFKFVSSSYTTTRIPPLTGKGHYVCGSSLVLFVDIVIRPNKSGWLDSPDSQWFEC